MPARPEPVAAWQPARARRKQTLARRDPFPQRLRRVPAARASVAKSTRRRVALRVRPAPAMRPLAQPVLPVLRKQLRFAALPASLLALRRKPSIVAPWCGLAPVIRKLLPVQRARRQAAQPGPETRPARVVRALSKAFRLDCPRAGRPEARSTSADPAPGLMPVVRPARRRVATAPVPARVPPVRVASFRRAAHCCRARPPRRPGRSRCSPSPCGRRSEHKYTFCPAGMFRPCRISVRPPVHWRRSSTRSWPARAHSQPIACGDSIPWLNMTW